MMGVSIATLERDLTFRERHKVGKAQSNISLRRKQYQIAMKGNITMLVWLGKQNLGQTERSSIEHSGGVDFSSMPREELERMVKGVTVEGEYLNEQSTTDGTTVPHMQGPTPTLRDQPPPTKVPIPPISPSPSPEFKPEDLEGDSLSSDMEYSSGLGGDFELS